MANGYCYVSEPEFRNFIKDEELGDALYNLDTIEAISDYLDQKLGRKAGFGKDSEDTVRYYYPKAVNRPRREDWAESENPFYHGGLSRVLDIDDVVTVTSVVSGTETLDESSYELYSTRKGLNAAVYGEPFNQIRLLSGAFTPGTKVTVTGLHGWPEVPKAIKLATVRMAAMLQGKDPLSTNRYQELDAVVDASPQVRAILMGLMTNYSGGVFF